MGPAPSWHPISGEQFEHANPHPRWTCILRVRLAKRTDDSAMEGISNMMSSRGNSGRNGLLFSYSPNLHWLPTCPASKGVPRGPCPTTRLLQAFPELHVECSAAGLALAFLPMSHDYFSVPVTGAMGARQPLGLTHLVSAAVAANWVC